MTIIEMAKKVGAIEYEYEKPMYDYDNEYTFTKNQLEAFAELIRADERAKFEPVAWVTYRTKEWFGKANGVGTFQYKQRVLGEAENYNIPLYAIKD
jgi:hypothetical protein